MSPARRFEDEVRVYLKAGYPILYVVTPEEERAIDLIRRAADKRKVLVWSIARGLCDSADRAVDAKTADPRRVLPFLAEYKEPGVFVMEDFHAVLDERSPHAMLVNRQLRDLAASFPRQRKTLVLLSPVLKIPPELEKDVTVVDLDPPDEVELGAVLDQTVDDVKDNPRVEVNLEEGGKEQLVRALTGLTKVEAENALAKLVVMHSRLDPEDVDALLAEKEQIVRKSGMLEFYGSPEKFGAIGGLELLKAWLRQRGTAFSEKARAFGLPNPKGLLLVGVPGCGKSLTAKSVAAEWRMPLLKFDLSKVFGSLVGEAEANMRKALRMGEAVAPCVVWIDEIEKGLAGARGGAGDGGVTTRVFGTLLTWMEENRKPVFVVATANDIDGLPPELLRKGRFDEIFFVDLPTRRERANVLRIHVERARRDPSEFDLMGLAEAMPNFSGAEIEQVVVEALHLAYAEGGESATLEDRHLMAAVGTTRPLAESLAARIGRLREEAKRWRAASHGEDAPGEDAMAEGVGQEPRTPGRPGRRRRVFEEL